MTSTLLESVDGFEVDVAVADGKVGALDQREAQVFCQVRVLEEGLVVRAGGEQHDAWVVAGGREAGEGVALGAEEVGEAEDVRGGERARGGQVGDDGAVF